MNDNNGSTSKHFWHYYDFGSKKWYQLNMFEETPEELAERLEKTEHGRHLLDQMEYPHKYENAIFIISEEKLKEMFEAWNSFPDDFNLHSGIEY